jgi:drug/metabolite transporter (DMT)-like permease
MPPITLRRVGGVVLMVVGLLLVVGPLSYLLAPHQAHEPKVLGGLAYQATLGLFLLILGLYFLTRRPKKGPDNHG